MFPVLGIPLNTYVLLVVAITAVAAAVALWRPTTLNLRRLARNLGIVAAIVALAAIPILVFVDIFGVMQLLYETLVIAVPVAGLALLARTAFGKTRARVGVPLGLLALMPGLIGYYATNIEPKLLEVNSFTVPSDLDQPVRVGVIADIQSVTVGPHETASVGALSALNPDIVLVAGDTYSGEDQPFPENFEDFSSLLNGLEATEEVFFVEGDHDTDDWLPRLVATTDHQLLVNEVAIVEVRGQRIAVLGLQNDNETPAALAALERLATVDADYRIVLAHHPDAIFTAPPGVDLVVGGHTHGGQVQVPFFGPIFTFSDIPRHQAAGGLYRYPDTWLFVTRGVGLSHGSSPILRLNAKPEVNLLVLSPTPG